MPGGVISDFPKWIILSEREYIFKNHGVAYDIILGMEDIFCAEGADLVTISPLIDIANRLVYKFSRPFVKNELAFLCDRSIPINSTYYLYISMSYAGLKMVVPTLRRISKKNSHVVLYCFDTWESLYQNWDEAFREIQPRAIFFAYKKARDFFSKKYRDCFFLPQSADNRIFYPRKIKKQRLFMQMGRRNECIHNMILGYLEEHGIDDSPDNYIYEREKGKVIFPDIQELATEICKSMFFVAAPQSLENRNLTGNISEVTARFYEAMACKTLIIGFKPDTYDELFPEDSMVELRPDGSDFAQKIDYFLEHPGEYENIVNRNYEYLMKHHTWGNRYETMVSALIQS